MPAVFIMTAGAYARVVEVDGEADDRQVVGVRLESLRLLNMCHLAVDKYVAPSWRRCNLCASFHVLRE